MAPAPAPAPARWWCLPAPRMGGAPGAGVLQGPAPAPPACVSVLGAEGCCCCCCCCCCGCGCGCCDGGGCPCWPWSWGWGWWGEGCGLASAPRLRVSTSSGFRMPEMDLGARGCSGFTCFNADASACAAVCRKRGRGRGVRWIRGRQQATLPSIGCMQPPGGVTCAAWGSGHAGTPSGSASRTMLRQPNAASAHDPAPHLDHPHLAHAAHHLSGQRARGSGVPACVRGGKGAGSWHGE